MKRGTFLFCIGVLVFSVPFLGVPEAWKSIMLYVLGTLTILVALSCRFEAKRSRRGTEDAFHTEHNPGGDM